MKYWAYSCSSQENTQPENICDIVFEKNKRWWWDSKQNECLCGSSHPKGSLKIVLREISQNSQENVYKLLTLPRRLQGLFKTSWRRLARCLQDVLKTCSRCICKTSSRRICKTSSRRLEEALKTSWKTKNCYAKDVLKTCLEGVLKTSWR